MNPPGAGRAWIAAGALASLIVTLSYGLNSDGMWSFAARCDNRDTITFYYAAQAALRGLNPYDNPAIQQAFGVFAWWVYPPTGLAFFLPLTALSFAHAIIAFNVAKALAAVALVAVWGRTLPALRRDIAFWLFAAVGLNTTVLQDACSGNIAIFETLAVWSALLLSLRGRYVPAVAVIVLIALAKPTWLVMLALPLAAAPRVRQAWQAAIGGLAVGAALLLLWVAADYDSFAAWLHNARSTLSIRYNLFELIKDLRLGLGGSLDAPLWQRPEYALYLMWILLVGWLVWQRWRALQVERSPLPALVLIVGFAAANPANLSYSWLVTLPAVYLAMLQAHWPMRLLIGMLALMPPVWSALVLPLRDVGMVALLVVILAFLTLALEAPQRRTSLQTID